MVIVGPDGPRAFKKYWEEQEMPFIGLADIGSKIAGLYQQEVNILKFGRMPAEFIVDKHGKIQFQHYGESMRDIPSINDLLLVINNINQK